MAEWLNAPVLFNRAPRGKPHGCKESNSAKPLALSEVTPSEGHPCRGGNV
ncbi:Uncharacterised protein [Bordetella pertussis]|nr:Uncharacterised protein [Bordetella pertussis]CFP64697.1 Uncharacterised protein [Bordetella pertussis]